MLLCGSVAVRASCLLVTQSHHDGQLGKQMAVKLVLIAPLRTAQQRVTVSARKSPACQCRYSCFIPLYPLGIIGEALLTVRALPYIRQRSLFSVRLPNAANFAFDYHWFCLVSALLLTMLVIALPEWTLLPSMQA